MNTQQHYDEVQVMPIREDSSFEEVVAEYKDMLLNVILGIVQNREEAEDILQEVFIKFFEFTKRGNVISTKGTWLYRVAVNHSLDALRRQKQVVRGGWLKRVFKVQEEDIPPIFEHPGVLLQQKENASILFKALREIPEKQMVAFLLQQLEAKTVIEIAAILNTTTSAAEALLKRAKQNLRKVLSKKSFQY